MDHMTAPPYSDNCPTCGSRANPPLTTTRVNRDGVRCQYRCRACLWSWWTGWANWNGNNPNDKAA